MNDVLTSNTQAILLLTAPLIVGHRSESETPLTTKEYNLLAVRLRELQRQPSDLLTPNADEVLQECRSAVDATRVRRLLERGFLLSQAVERWHSRAIWVVSRADGSYPPRLKQRLKDLAPPIIYGCGDCAILSSGGLAIVGSRHVEQDLLEYAVAVGKQAAQAQKTVVSGGAKGVDDAAMRGAMSAEGKVVGVLADSLEKAALNRQYRDCLLRRGLVLVSPYDPNASFDVGHALRRNTLIYALADAALVVNSDHEKGGTWAGATEQLERFHFVPVYVRSTGEVGDGIRALLRKGALSWPNPTDAAAFEATLRASPEPKPQGQNELPFTGTADAAGGALTAPPAPTAASEPVANGTSSLAAELFLKFRDLVIRMLAAPMEERDISATLQLTEHQTREWLERLILEGLVRRQSQSWYEIAIERPLAVCATEPDK
jgi:predicted Rossmann fold nucleotide-binding protein DprA/Smf involved in DNA uptake